MQKILIITGPTASGKSARAIAEAQTRGGEVISVDSRQVYRGLDIGTEKLTKEEMQGVPHHLIDILEPSEVYSAGDFVHDAKMLIAEIDARGHVPILAGGTHFYFDSLINGLPQTPINQELRTELEKLPIEALYERISQIDPRRASELDSRNRRRLVRALELAAYNGTVPARVRHGNYAVEWMLIEPTQVEIRAKIDTRLGHALERGLIEETNLVRTNVGDERLNELGLEYRVVGEHLRGERTKESLFPALSAKLFQYARRQKAWLRKLREESLTVIP